jgi:hypothetical protein
MDSHKAFNKCCKMIYARWNAESPCNEITVVYNTFRLLKSVKKTIPMKVFVDKFLKHKHLIEAKDVDKILDVFISEHPIYQHLQEGLRKSWYSMTPKLQQFMWNQVDILVEITQKTS